MDRFRVLSKVINDLMETFERRYESMVIPESKVHSEMASGDSGPGSMDSGTGNEARRSIQSVEQKIAYFCSKLRLRPPSLTCNYDPHAPSDS